LGNPVQSDRYYDNTHEYLRDGHRVTCLYAWLFSYVTVYGALYTCIWLQFILSLTWRKSQ